MKAVRQFAVNASRLAPDEYFSLGGTLLACCAGLTVVLRPFAALIADSTHARMAICAAFAATVFVGPFVVKGLRAGKSGDAT